MGTVNDFAQGMLREYSAFAGQCAALVASPGDEATAAELFAMEDLPLIVEQLRALRARAEAAEAALAAAQAARAEAVAAARAEGEAAGRAAERAAVVAFLRAAEWTADEADHIERGAHVALAAGGAR